MIRFRHAIFAGLMIAAGPAWADPPEEHREKLQARLSAAREQNKQLLQQARTREALDLQREIVALHRQLCPPETFPQGFSELGFALDALGSLYRVNQQPQKAVEAYTEALAIRRRLYPPATHPDGHPSVAGNLERLAELRVQQMQFDQGRAGYEEALAIWTKQYPAAKFPNGHADLGRVHHNLASLCRQLGDYDRALDHISQAVKIRKALLHDPARPTNHPDLIASVQVAGMVVQALGEYDRALPCFELALEMARQRYPSEQFPLGSVEQANALEALASIHRLRGELALALSLQEQAVGMYRRLFAAQESTSGTGAVMVALNNLALIHHQRGEIEPARTLYQEALDRARKLYPPAQFPDGHTNLAFALNNLAYIQQNLGDFRQAVALHEEALAIRQKLFPPDRYPQGHPDLAISLLNLGYSRALAGDAARGIALARQAIELQQKLYRLFSRGHPDLATSESTLAWIHKQSGDAREALAHYDAALNSLRAPGAPEWSPELFTPANLLLRPMTVQVLGQRGTVLEQLLQGPEDVLGLTRAMLNDRLAMGVLDRMRHETLEREESKLKLGADYAGLAARRVGWLARLFERDHDGARLVEAFQAIEQNRARVFVEVFGRTRAGMLAGLPPEVQAREEALRRKLLSLDARLARLERVPGKDKETLDLQRERHVAAEELRKQVADLASQDTRYASLIFPQPCSLPQARAVLHDNEVALLFAVGHQRSQVLVVTRDPKPDDPARGLHVFPLPGRAELLDLVAGLTQREALQAPGRYLALARPAHAVLLAPLADLIRGKDLLIVPDGPLGLLPFELLHDGRRTVLENHRVRYAPSLTALHLIRRWELERPGVPDRPFFGLGDPTYTPREAGSEVQLARHERLERSGLGGLADYPPLPASGVEVRALGRLLQAEPRAVLTGDQATEAAVKAASADGRLAQCRYVHFAVHGDAGLDADLPPALALSPVGATGQRDEFGCDDGLLRIDEAINLKLNADLVVLSACSSGQGKLVDGEGVTGLARAFLHAGARGVIASLWAIDDARTAALMQEAYQELRKGVAAPDALRAARLTLIRRGEPPFFWAAFIHIGD